MLTHTEMALAAALILGAAGVARASTTGFTGSGMSTSSWANVAVPAGVNPSNSQDLTYRSNPQD